MTDSVLEFAPGDRVYVPDGVLTDSGCVLDPDRIAYVEVVIPGSPAVGIRWTDAEGTHVMAISKRKLGRVL